jgi:hypothetical protein
MDAPESHLGSATLELTRKYRAMALLKGGAPLKPRAIYICKFNVDLKVP